MPRFTVQLARSVPEYAVVEVEATDAYAAEAAAMDVVLPEDWEPDYSGRAPMTAELIDACPPSEDSEND